MNPNTNELVNLEKMNQEMVDKMTKQGFRLVPKKYSKEATELLGSKKSVIVPDDNKPLSTWARKKRSKKSQIKFERRQNHLKKRRENEINQNIVD